MRMGNCFSFVTIWLKKTRSYDPTDSLPIGSKGPIESYNPKNSTNSINPSCDQDPSTSNHQSSSSYDGPTSLLTHNNNLKPGIPVYNGERRPSILKTGERKLVNPDGSPRRVSFSAILDEQLHYEIDDDQEVFKMGSVEEEDDSYYKYATPHSYFSDFSLTAVA